MNIKLNTPIIISRSAVHIPGVPQVNSRYSTTSYILHQSSQINCLSLDEIAFRLISFQSSKRRVSQCRCMGLQSSTKLLLLLAVTQWPVLSGKVGGGQTCPYLNLT